MKTGSSIIFIHKGEKLKNPIVFDYVWEDSDDKKEDMKRKTHARKAARKSALMIANLIE